MKINQYCSVCKKHLDMDVIPTDDGGDDGVIWLRCPECQGFLPKFTGDGLKQESAEDAESPTTTDAVHAFESEAETEAPVDGSNKEDDDDGVAVRRKTRAKGKAEPPVPEEPVAEYAEMLAAADPETARPYRSTSEYVEGDLVHHLAYGDLGIVVAKENLPGGRRAIKVFFEEAGVVHLIEQAADGR